MTVVRDEDGRYQVVGCRGYETGNFSTEEAAWEWLDKLSQEEYEYFDSREAE